MIEFTTSFSSDYRLACNLAEWVEKSDIEHVYIPCTGYAIHRMHEDDFRDFMYEYFDVKVDV